MSSAEQVTRLRERLAHVQHDLKSAVSRKPGPQTFRDSGLGFGD